MNREEMLEEISDRLNADETEYCDQIESHFLLAELKRVEAELSDTRQLYYQVISDRNAFHKGMFQWQTAAMDLQSKLDVASEVLRIIDYTNRSRGYPTGPEWMEIMGHVTKAIAQIQRKDADEKEK